MASDTIYDNVTKQKFSRNSPSEAYAPIVSPTPNASTAPIAPNTPVVNSDALTSEPAVKIPDAPVSTAGVGAQGFFESFLKNQQLRIAAETAKATAASTAADSSKKTLEDTMASLLAVPGEQAKLEKKADIAGKTQRVNDYTSQLESEQLAVRRQVEKIRKNEAGLFGGAVEDEVNRVERESLSKQADLSLLQVAANRDLLTAQSIIDKKIALITEPLKQKLEFDKFFYQDNKDTFTKAEERAFNLQNNADQRALDHATKELETIHSAYLTAAQNGAPESVLKAILASQDSAGALGAASGYMVDPLERELKRLQIAKARQDLAPEGDGLLSVEEAIKLGVPYGTTKSEAMSASVDKANAAKEAERAATKANLDQIDNLKASAGLATAVGPNSAARVSLTEKFTSRRSNFIAGVQKLTGQLTLDKLIDSKSQGATFGALSLGELKLLANAATKISKWEIHENPLDPDSPVIGYKTTESEFNKELDTIRTYMSLAYDSAPGPEDTYLTDVDAALKSTLNPYVEAGYLTPSQ